MAAIRMVISLALILLFGLCAVFNAISFWKRGIRGEQYPSGVPLVGGLFGMFGLLLLSIPAVSHFAWLALVLDYGCLPYIIGVSLYLMQDAYVHNRRFLVMQLQGQHTDGTNSSLNLYHNGDYILKQTEMPLSPTVFRSTIGKWRQEADALVLENAKESVRYEPAEGALQFQWSPTSDVGWLEGVPLQIIQEAA